MIDVGDKVILKENYHKVIENVLDDTSEIYDFFIYMDGLVNEIVEVHGREIKFQRPHIEIPVGKDLTHITTILNITTRLYPTALFRKATHKDMITQKIKE